MEAVDELMSKYFLGARKNEVCCEIVCSCLEYCEQEIEGEAKVVLTLSKVLDGL